MKLAETRTTAATVAAIGNATWRYAIVMLGGTPRTWAAKTTPRMPKNRLTAKESRVTTNVASNTRTGIMYQRIEPGAEVAGIASRLPERRRLLVVPSRDWRRLRTGCPSFERVLARLETVPKP